MAVRLGDIAPDFTAETTEGTINFHEWLGNSSGGPVLPPEGLTPVCTTELGAFAKAKGEFDKRNAKIIGLSVDSVERTRVEQEHRGDPGPGRQLPAIGDPDRKVADLYDMIHPNANDTVHGALGVHHRGGQEGEADHHLPGLDRPIVDEVLRVLDSLAADGRLPGGTPVNWKDGRRRDRRSGRLRRGRQGEVPEGVEALKPYLRVTPQPNK